MRVRISYGVDIEEVPSEVLELFGTVYTKSKLLEKQVETIEALLESKDTESSRELMNKMRQTMTEMDTRLSDLCLILEGYRNFKAQQEQGEKQDDNKVQTGRPTVAAPSSNNVQGQREPDGSEAQ